MASGAVCVGLSVKDDDLILLPKKPISDLNYTQKEGKLNVSVNAGGWIVALAKNKESIEETKKQIEDYQKKATNLTAKEKMIESH